MGYIKHRTQIYNAKLERKGLKGVAMYLLDEIERVNKGRINQDILTEYDLIKKFFDEMKKYYK
jgi:hypothetical protein